MDKNVFMCWHLISLAYYCHLCLTHNVAYSIYTNKLTMNTSVGFAEDNKTYILFANNARNWALQLPSGLNAVQLKRKEMHINKCSAKSILQICSSLGLWLGKSPYNPALFKSENWPKLSHFTPTATAWRANIQLKWLSNEPTYTQVHTHTHTSQ